MSRCKTGWRIVCVPFGVSRWYAVNERKKDAKCFQTWDEAKAYVCSMTCEVAR
jgi:hypothetical protein